VLLCPTGATCIGGLVLQYLQGRQRRCVDRRRSGDTGVCKHHVEVAESTYDRGDGSVGQWALALVKPEKDNNRANTHGHNDVEHTLLSSCRWSSDCPLMTTCSAPPSAAGGAPPAAACLEWRPTWSSSGRKVPECGHPWRGRPPPGLAAQRVQWFQVFGTHRGVRFMRSRQLATMLINCPCLPGSMVLNGQHHACLQRAWEQFSYQHAGLANPTPVVEFARQQDRHANVPMLKACHMRIS
jgi:hypothetical protein